MSLGEDFAVSQASNLCQAQCLPAACGSDGDPQLLLQPHVWLCATMPLAMMMMDYPSETVSQPGLKAFFFKSCFVMVSSQQWSTDYDKQTADLVALNHGSLGQGQDDSAG